MSALRRRLSVRWLLPSLALAALAIVDAAAFFNGRASGTALTGGGGGSSTPSGVSTQQRRDSAIIPASRGLASTPRLKFSTAHLDLGDGKPKEILRGELTLSNPSSASVAFSLIKHCGCTELSPMKGVLPPRGKETIQVGVELPGHANSEKSTRVEVQTGDPAEIVADCVLSARCPAPFQVTPAFINFGSLVKGDLAAATADVRLESIPGQPPLDAEKLLIEHADEAFCVEWAKTPSAQSAILRVSLKDDLPPGDLHDTLELHMASSDQVMRVSLNATFVEPISVVPRTVVLHRDRKAGHFRPMLLLVIARGGGNKRLGTVSVVNGPHRIQVEDLGDVAAGRRRIRVIAPDHVDDWPKESQVWLQSDNGHSRFGFKLVKSS